VLIEIIIDKSSETIQIDEAFKLDLEALVARFEKFAEMHNADISSLNFRGLVPKMVRGIMGCERGCPADAKDLISKGYQGFKLQYIEGGILTAKAVASDSRPVSIKMFPDF